ncbi:MAG: hypothetical protein KAR40_11125 [Candidatus Sabulitectum sp.]|nr:hypothetical protein [Candidatus Sabulitectum sp.]
MASKTKADPTGQRNNRAKAIKQVNKRLAVAFSKVLTLFNAIPRTRRTEAKVGNASSVVYDYDISPQQIETLEAEVTTLIAISLGTTDERVPANWWYKPNIELPFRQGVTQELIEFNQLIAGAAVAGVTVRGMPPRPLPVELVLSSPKYFELLNYEYVRNYGIFSNLSSQTSYQVMERIEAGMQAGATPSMIADDIAERFKVAGSNASRIVRTEVNWSYNNARMSAIELAAGETGLRSAVMHISSLTPTTRTWHAARHGKVYNVADQRAWWSRGANQINCLCSVHAVLVDDEGNVVS